MSIKDIELLDELSKSTLASYITKSAVNAAAHAKAQIKSREKSDRMTRDHDYEGADMQDRITKAHKLKSASRLTGVGVAASKLSEDQLDELSKETLRDYIKKSSSEIGAASRARDNAINNKPAIKSLNAIIKRRFNGVKKASSSKVIG